MKSTRALKLLALAMFCAPQVSNAFVWENNDEKRKEWREIVKNTFIKECHNDPSESCLKSSSLIQLTKDVCGRVPPGVSAMDHRDIHREVCVNDVRTELARIEASVSNKNAIQNPTVNEQSSKVLSGSRENSARVLENKSDQELHSKEKLNEREILSLEEFRSREKIHRETEKQKIAAYTEARAREEQDKEQAKAHLEERQKAEAKRREMIENRTGVYGFLIDIFVVFSLVLAFCIVNFEAFMNKSKGLENDKT